MLKMTLDPRNNLNEFSAGVKKHDDSIDVPHGYECMNDIKPKFNIFEALSAGRENERNTKRFYEDINSNAAINDNSRHLCRSSQVYTCFKPEGVRKSIDKDSDTISSRNATSGSTFKPVRNIFDIIQAEASIRFGEASSDEDDPDDNEDDDDDDPGDDEDEDDDPEVETDNNYANEKEGDTFNETESVKNIPIIQEVPVIHEESEKDTNLLLHVCEKCCQPFTRKTRLSKHLCHNGIKNTNTLKNDDDNDIFDEPEEGSDSDGIDYDYDDDYESPVDDVLNDKDYNPSRRRKFITKLNTKNDSIVRNGKRSERSSAEYEIRPNEDEEMIEPIAVQKSVHRKRRKVLNCREKKKR